MNNECCNICKCSNVLSGPFPSSSYLCKHINVKPESKWLSVTVELNCRFSCTAVLYIPHKRELSHQFLKKQQEKTNIALIKWSLKIKV